MPRFYQGLWIALLSAPLARFGDTAANEGALALLEASALPVAAKTIVASCCAALWRIFIFPFDTVKTTLQVSGGAALRAKIAAGGLFSLYGGALGASFATLVGHYPWFATNNVLEGAVPDFGPRLKLARRALIGFVCSAVSDTVSNSIRVVKVYVQTSKVPSGYAAAVSHHGAGLGGLLWSGLPAKPPLQRDLVPSSSPWPGPPRTAATRRRTRRSATTARTSSRSCPGNFGRLQRGDWIRGERIATPPPSASAVSSVRGPPSLVRAGAPRRAVVLEAQAAARSDGSIMSCLQRYSMRFLSKTWPATISTGRVDADAALERPEQLALVGLRAEVDLGVRGELRPGERVRS